MIYVEHEGQQMLVGAGLMIVTATMQTSGVVLLQETVARIREAVTKRANPSANAGSSAERHHLPFRSASFGDGPVGGVLLDVRRLAEFLGRYV
jgi:hypothetical protein